MTPPHRQAFIGAGSNLGDRAATLTGAAQRLRETAGIEFLAVATVYETAPVGRVDQPDFLNTVIGVETALTPEALLAALLAIEARCGRVRSERWGPRTLDLDLLVFEGETRAGTALELPHPRMFERGFVIEPLRELLVQPRFFRAGWDELRARVAALPPAGNLRRAG